MISNQRQSNIELCRIVSIILVMILHSTFNAIAREANEPSFPIYYISALSVIGVNVFVLITGYFSVTPKITSLFNMAFICFFWMLLKIFGMMCFGDRINFQQLDYQRFYFITDSNWFIPCYIGLMFMSPILNAFCSIANKRQLLGGALSLVIVQVWFDLLPPYPNLRLGSHEGYSFFSFGVIYLIGRAIRLYGLPRWLSKYSLFLYLVGSLLTALLTFKINALNIIFAYNSPLVIFSAISFFAFFLKKKLDSNIINYLAKSTLAALLGHMAFTRVYKEQFRYLYYNYSGIELVILWIFSLLFAYSVCVAIDQLRLLLWKPINSRLISRIKNNNIF